MYTKLTRNTTAAAAAAVDASIDLLSTFVCIQEEEEEKNRQGVDIYEVYMIEIVCNRSESYNINISLLLASKICA